MVERHVAARDNSWVKAAVAPRLVRIGGLGRSEEGQVHPLRMARELAQRMAPDALFVGDGANCNNWYKATFRMQTSPGFLDHEPFGAMGTGLPYAIGAAAAFAEDGSSRQVYLGTGDGAFGQYLGELATASLHGLADFRDGRQRWYVGFDAEYHAAAVQRYDRRGHESEPLRRCR